MGSILMRLALGHVLFEEDPLASKHNIIAHVLKSNLDPRPVIEHSLKLRLAREVEIPAHILPGLKANAAGLIEGDEFHFVMPDSLAALIAWLETWDGTLKNKKGEEDKEKERVDVRLRPYVTLADWAAAFRDMESTYK